MKMESQMGMKMGSWMSLKNNFRMDVLMQIDVGIAKG